MIEHYHCCCYDSFQIEEFVFWLCIVPYFFRLTAILKFFTFTFMNSAMNPYFHFQPTAK